MDAFDFLSLDFEQVKSLEVVAMDKYLETDASAAQVLAELDRDLLGIGMEPDVSVVWQELYRRKELEQEWDNLSAEEQRDHLVPKGKQRKCDFCNKGDASYQCSLSKSVSYCNRSCKKLGYKKHKKICQQPKEKSSAA